MTAEEILKIDHYGTLFSYPIYGTLVSEYRSFCKSFHPDRCSLPNATEVTAHPKRSKRGDGKHPISCFFKTNRQESGIIFGTTKASHSNSGPPISAQNMLRTLWMSGMNSFMKTQLYKLKIFVTRTWICEISSIRSCPALHFISKPATNTIIFCEKIRV